LWRNAGGLHNGVKTGMITGMNKWRWIQAAVLCGFWAGSTGLYAEPSFSGYLDTTAVFGRSVSGDIVSGYEAFANVGMRETLGNDWAFYASVNAFAVTGVYAQSFVYTDPSLFNEKYIALLELDQLFFDIGMKKGKITGGLMPLRFGYGRVFAPSDFVQQKDPKAPGAHTRNTLHLAVHHSPSDNIDLKGFTAYPSNPLNDDFAEQYFGGAADFYFTKVNAQVVYAFQGASYQYSKGVHILGASFSENRETGFFADGSYRCEPAKKNNLDGLAFSLGGILPFFDGTLDVLLEALYNGKNSVTSSAVDGFLTSEYYLELAVFYRVSRSTALAARSLFGLTDGSALPAIYFTHDIRQGLNLSISLQCPVENIAPKIITKPRGKNGEFGPSAIGTEFNFTAKLRLRF
jgi:hypothetical protein